MTDIAQKIGLRSRINMIMQAAFFKLAKVIPLEDIKILKRCGCKFVWKRRKGCSMNHKAIDRE